jgi:hypothetical protein
MLYAADKEGEQHLYGGNDQVEGKAQNDGDLQQVVLKDSLQARLHLLRNAGHRLHQTHRYRRRDRGLAISDAQHCERDALPARRRASAPLNPGSSPSRSRRAERP